LHDYERPDRDVGPFCYTEHMFDCGRKTRLAQREASVGVVILGIDPGLANTGWGVVERDGSKLKCVAYGCITTGAREELAQRLLRIHDGVREAIVRYEPTECAVESVFFGSNAKSAFATGQARGVALLATADARLVLGDYSPVQIKNAVVGSGVADKAQVQYMVRVMLGLDHEPKPDHAADALAAAITHAHLRGRAALETASSAGADAAHHRTSARGVSR
jgi:crossover junction endodeoxyribonuclease RuvC